MTNNKVGGIYSIEDEQLKFDMIKITYNGTSCHTMAEFIRNICDGLGSKNRFIVCSSPGVYGFDLENVSGAASPIDAIKSYVDLILEGYTFYVWDTELNRIYHSEQNEYIYQTLEDMIEHRAGCLANATQTVTKSPCPDAELRKDTSKALGQEIFELIGKAGEILQEYASHLENISQYEYDHISLKRAERARDLAEKLLKFEDQELLVLGRSFGQ